MGKQVVKKEEAEVVIPRLGEKTIEEKYDMAVGAFLNDIKPQLKTDATKLNQMIADARKEARTAGEDESDAMWAAVDQFLEENPESPLGYYTGDDLINLKGKGTGTVNTDVIEKTIKEYLLGPEKTVAGKKIREKSEFKKEFMAAIMQSNTPKIYPDGSTTYSDTSIKVEDAQLYLAFSNFFSKNAGMTHNATTVEKNKLPVVVTYNEKKDSIIFSYPKALKVSKLEME
ncbi:hypothetical protein H0O02_00360 [Candidatus Micrarchaeota archaeon]|nr:hypothetical protein [Candidatus Micrarchaeota archaeon]